MKTLHDIIKFVDKHFRFPFSNTSLMGVDCYKAAGLDIRIISMFHFSAAMFLLGPVVIIGQQIYLRKEGNRSHIPNRKLREDCFCPKRGHHQN